VPRLQLILTDNWFRALNELGVPTVHDPDEGITAGGYFLASDIQPNNQTRSDARRTYYDPFFARKNYNILQNSHATRILFDNTNYDLPPYGNDSQGNNAASSTTEQTNRIRALHHAEKLQRKAPASLHATGVEVSQGVTWGLNTLTYNSTLPILLLLYIQYSLEEKSSFRLEQFIRLSFCSFRDSDLQLC
jgi:GMC oxidoreductase